jgi:uncharacterized damage-inducible protein DinB
MSGTPFEAMSDELTGLRTFLASQRASILEKSAGLTDEQATSRPTVSDFSMLTLVKHVAHMERRWFQLEIARRQIEGLWPPPDDRELRIEEGDTIESVRALYEATIAENVSILADVTELDSVSPATGLNRRWVLMHVIEELARHAGHADIIRESLDGTKGI